MDSGRAVTLREDVDFDPTEESTDECFDCGTVVTAAAPGCCPKCGVDMRNRRMPIE